ncbi:MAG: Fe-S cluster assembly protein SufD [Deltaproteobacteria bacterium]|nr:MAG: Fe-S cluster assembly protein SufD [Deltaproteobacteria bacterium]
MSRAETQPYLERFRRLEPSAAEPTWLHGMRDAAIERFAEFGFPSPRLEDWKYTSVRSIATSDFGGAPPARNPFSKRDVAFSLGGDFHGRILAFADGRYAPELSTIEALPEGVIAESLATALAGRPACIEPHLGRVATWDAPEDAFVALNTAFLGDGAFVYLPRGAVVEAPIGLVFLGLRNGAAPISQPRILIVAEAGSRATIVESYAGCGPDAYLTNAVTEVVVGAGASIDHVKLQCESGSAFHVSALQAQQSRDSRFASHAISLGAALARNDVNARIDDAGAEAVLNGLFVASAAQHVDNHTEIDHAKPHSQSRELYKGILAGRAHGVFNGKIIVRPDAQNTHAQQANDNLLMSEDARINSKPELMIHADDVKCSHGSTIGYLDESALFYLRSRGISAVEAREFMMRAFASEVTRAIGSAPVRTRVDELVTARLARGAPLEIA